MDFQMVVSALGCRTRADILRMVTVRPQNLTELAHALHLGVPSIYAAVTKLESAGLVVSRRRGRQRLVRSRYRKIDLLFRDMT